jgi:hypothetical protein
MSEVLVSAAELSRLSGLSEFTLQKLSREGKIPCIRINPRVIRFRPSEVEAALANMRPCPTTPAKPCSSTVAANA